MNHTLEIHKTYLDKLCRICGRTNLTVKEKKQYKKPYLCELFARDILFLFELDIKSDLADKHSIYLCHKCAASFRNINKRKSVTLLKSVKNQFESACNIWCQFSPSTSITDCSICSHITSLTQGCIKTHTQLPNDTPLDLHGAQHTIDSQEASNDDTCSVDISSIPIPVASSTPTKSPVPLKVDSSTSPMTKKDCLFSTSLGKPHDQPLDKQEEELNTHFIRRKLHSNTDKTIVKFKTKGQPITFQKIVAPRKNSSSIKSPTKRKRIKIMHNTRTYIAGTSSNESHDTLLASEIKRIPPCRRKTVCSKAGIRQKVRISKAKTLAIKEALGLSWHQGRKHGKLLKEMGVQLENENSVRNYAKEIVKDFILVEYRSFLCQSAEHQVPYGRIQNLPKFLDYLLDSNEEEKMLTWHEIIPHNEIWVKVGGDHGKHSLKFTLQIINTPKPNSKLNTAVIAMAAVKDNHDNMIRFLEGGLGDDIKALHNHQWKGKSIRLFVNGDYEFLTKMYGLSGPSGTYPCLWCEVSKYALKYQSAPSPKRTLKSIRNEHEIFMKNENGNKKEVAQYHNALHSPMLDVELDHIAPPYLHILLGIVVKHHRLLEAASHDLDIKLLSQREVDCTDLGCDVKKYGGNWKQAVSLKERIEFYGTQLALCELYESETPESIAQKQAQLESTEKELSMLDYTPLAPRSGPIASSLDPILKKHHITPQAYHSRSFVGNHCHKYLHPLVYEDLTDTVVKQTQSCTKDPLIRDHAHTIKARFDITNNLFEKLHTAISHSRQVDTESLDDIEIDIKNYMQVFRREFPKQTLPKHHILEHHCVPFMKQFQFGLSLLGEQGTEASHQLIAKLETRASGIAQELKRLEFVMNAHLLHITPTLRT